MNELNLEPNEFKYIYRIFSQDYFEASLVNKELTLVAPSLWEDPYENVFFKYFDSHQRRENETGRWHGENLFGQCWSSLEESDAMWRIYSQDLKGVKVKIDRTMLRPIFYNHFDIYLMRDCFIGKVKYLTEQEILEVIKSDNFQNSNSMNDTGHTRAFGLLFKRNEFSHEKEIRIICDVQEPIHATKKNILNIAIEPNSLFSEIVLDPRLPIEQFELKKEIYQKLGFMGSIKKSNLYNFSI